MSLYLKFYHEKALETESEISSLDRSNLELAIILSLIFKVIQ